MTHCIPYCKEGDVTITRLKSGSVKTECIRCGSGGIYKKHEVTVEKSLASEPRGIDYGIKDNGD